MRRGSVSRRRGRRLPHVRPAVPLLRRLPQLPDAGVLGRLRRVRRRHHLGFRFGHPSFHVPVRVRWGGSVGGHRWRSRRVRLSGPTHHGVEGLISARRRRTLAHFRVGVLAVLSCPRGDLGKLPALRTEVRGQNQTSSIFFYPSRFFFFHHLNR